MTTPNAPIRILIAEDDWTSRVMLAALLRKWGYDPVVTENGTQAWEVLQQPDAPRLVLLDWTMPELDGLAVIARLRALNLTNPPYIILLTSNSDKAQMITGLDAGANDYIIKPYDPEELPARLRVGLRVLELQTHLIEARDALTKLALFDDLTGVCNRRASERALAQEIARAQREHGALTVGMCDLDYFKTVNDTYGHLIGDDILAGCVRRMASELREYDHIGRWGGEEFLILLPGYALDDAIPIYQRLRHAIADRPIPTRRGEVPITMSIGVATWTGEPSWEDLLAAADAALYDAKHQGRNCVCVAAQSSKICQTTSTED